MGVVKRSVSFDAAVWDELDRRAGGEPLSPLINAALDHYLRREKGVVAVAAYEAEFGSFTDEELADADRALDAAGVPDLNKPVESTRQQRPRPRSRRPTTS